jgi:hypothetical protein
MKRRTVAALIVLLGIAIAVFACAPVVYSPLRVGHCLPPGNEGCRAHFFATYESPSCAVLGIGVGHDNVTAGLGDWSYYAGCPPKVVYTP